MNLFRYCNNSKQQGDVGLARAIAWFSQNGYTVSVPLTDSQDYDLVVERNGDLLRVQVKTTKFKDGKYYQVALQTRGGNQSWSGTIKTFIDTEVELLYIVCDNGTEYMIPAREITSRNSLNLGEKYADWKTLKGDDPDGGL